MGPLLNWAHAPDPVLPGRQHGKVQAARDSSTKHIYAVLVQKGAVLSLENLLAMTAFVDFNERTLERVSGSLSRPLCTKA